MSEPRTASSWRRRARELRANIFHFNEPANRALILRCADKCENAAERAARLQIRRAPENHDAEGNFMRDPYGYFAGRREHAWILRCQGLTFKAIGRRLGVTAGRAGDMICKHARTQWPRRCHDWVDEEPCSSNSA